MKSAPLISILFSALLLGVATAQSTFEEDTARAEQLRQEVKEGITNLGLQITWLHDESHLWYNRQTASGGHEAILVDTITGKKKPAFDHAKVAESLGIDAQQLRVHGLEFGDEPDTLLIKTDKQGYLINLTTSEISETEALPPPVIQKFRGKRNRKPQKFPLPRKTSPDRASSIELRDHNLFLIKNEGEPTQLTNDGEEGHSYQNSGFWSPDSKRVVVMRVREAQKHPVHMVESSPEDRVQPKLFTHEYLKAGDRIEQATPHLFDVESGEEIPVDPSLFSDPWRNNKLHWSPAGDELRFVHNRRGHQIMRVIGIHRDTGATRTIIEEKSPTFIDYSQKHFHRFLPETDEIIWSSERDGWHQLYLFDAKTGTQKNQITKGEWIVRSVEEIDTKKRQITFRAMGIFPEQNPYHIHFARINFDGTGLVHLTEGDGTHELDYSPSKEFYIDSFSRVDLPPVRELRRRSDGKKIADLHGADISALESSAWRTPQRFVAKGRDGKTDIHGIIARPSNFDPAKKYPVIEKIYAGPHGHFVPTKFSPFHHIQALAEHGFILVQIDGMGTNFRSKAFHDHCWQNLMDAGFPDRIAWLKAAAKDHPELDLERVGIFGGSAGGQSTVAGMLNFPDFYKVGVSDCGCHDNRMDKVWWNEAWMGIIGPHYAANSNVTHAHKLRGKLLLTVGELDRNVDPASTMQVVNALIKADRDFDMIVVPGAGHGVGEAPYMARRRLQYFIEHLK